MRKTAARELAALITEQSRDRATHRVSRRSRSLDDVSGEKGGRTGHELVGAEVGDAPFATRTVESKRRRERKLPKGFAAVVETRSNEHSYLLALPRKGETPTRVIGPRDNARHVELASAAAEAGQRIGRAMASFWIEADPARAPDSLLFAIRVADAALQRALRRAWIDVLVELVAEGAHERLEQEVTKRPPTPLATWSTFQTRAASWHLDVPGFVTEAVVAWLVGRYGLAGGGGAGGKLKADSLRRLLERPRELAKEIGREAKRRRDRDANGGAALEKLAKQVRSSLSKRAQTLR